MIDKNRIEWNEQWKLYDPSFKLWDTDFIEWRNNIINQMLMVTEESLKK